MRLGRPLAAASVMAAAIGASLAASPALAGDSLAFKFAEDQQVIVNPSDTAFSVSGTGCTGKDAAVGIALHTSKGPRRRGQLVHHAEHPRAGQVHRR